MTTLLLRVFIRDYNPADPGRSRSAIGSLSGWVGITCNLLLFMLKLAAGLLAGSLSIIADAVNNLSDAASSVVTLWGMRMSLRPADEHHPYGHARYEYLSGFVVAAMILFIGFELAKSSIGRILRPEPIAHSAAAIFIMAFSMLVKIWMTLFYRRMGRCIASTTLRAASADSRNDGIATAAVLLGCLLHHFTGVNADGWIGLFVALFILWSGVGIARETISPLLGRQADPALLDSIRSLILRRRDILGIHDLLVHDYGPGRYFASVHVELSAEQDAQTCHDIIDAIECEALRELNVNLVIHHDPVAVNDAELNETRTLLEEILREIDPGLSMHDLRILRDSRRSKLMFDLEVPYAMSDRCGDFKREIDAALQRRGRYYRTIIRFDSKA